MKWQELSDPRLDPVLEDIIKDIVELTGQLRI